MDGAVTLNASAVLKVIAVKDGLADSPVTSGLFRVKPNPGGPVGYEQCATEDQVCGFPGTASVAYGANGNYTYGVFDGRVRCSSAVFGGDPAPGSAKKCFFQTDTADRAAKPRIAPAGGTFGAAQEVTITSATADAEIRYTTDGSFPTAASTLYTTPITVDTTRWIKAVAIAPGLESSPLAVVSFSIVDTSGGPEGYEFCATQFQTCSFPGSAVVAYGGKEASCTRRSPRRCSVTVPASAASTQPRMWPSAATTSRSARTRRSPSPSLPPRARTPLHRVSRSAPPPPPQLFTTRPTEPRRRWIPCVHRAAHCQ